MGFGVQAAVAPTPLNHTLASMKTEVARYVNFPDDEEAQDRCAAAINDAVRMLNSQTWYWMLTFQDIWMVVDQADYSLASNFKASFHLELLDSSDNPAGYVELYDPKKMFRTFPSATTSGKPQSFFIKNSAEDLLLSFNVMPEQSFVSSYPKMRHHYYRRLAMLANDSDVLIVPSEVELFVSWYAQWKMALQFDSRLAPDAMREKNMVWKQLRRDDNEHHNHNWSGS